MTSATTMANATAAANASARSAAHPGASSLSLSFPLIGTEYSKA